MPCFTMIIIISYKYKSCVFVSYFLSITICFKLVKLSEAKPWILFLIHYNLF